MYQRLWVWPPKEVLGQNRKDALDLLDEARVILRRAEPTAESDVVDEVQRQLANGRLTTAVVGEFKRGKSTLLGALVGDPDLFPTDVDIATNLVTSVEFAPIESVTAYVGDPTDAVAVPIDRSEIAAYVTERGNPGNTRAVRLMRIRTPIARLESGLILLDTPGAGALNIEHTAVTHAIIGSVDVAIFVLDALTPLTVQELALLDSVYKQAARLLVVMTKIDLVSDITPVMTNTRIKLAGRLGSEQAERIPIIPVSSAAKLDWLRTNDPESLAVSNFAELESTLWALLAEHGEAILVARSLGRLVRTIDDVSAPLSAELVARTATADDVDAARTRLNGEQTRLAGLAGVGASWRSTLLDAFDEIRSVAEARLGREMEPITAGLEARLTERDAVERADAIQAQLQRDVLVVWSNVVREIRRGVAALADSVEASTGLHLSPVLGRTEELHTESMFARPVNRPARESGGGTALSWLGEVLGVFYGDITVYVVGQLAGFFLSRTTQSKKRREEFVAQVRAQVAHAHGELGNQLRGLVDAADMSMTADFEAVIKADRMRTDSVGDALRVAPDRNGLREGNLRNTLRELAVLREQATAVVERALAAGRPALTP